MGNYKTRSEKKFDRLEMDGLRWCYGGKGSSPPPPDYTGAAIASGEASKEVTEQQTWANRPNQYTPWGATEWQNRQVWDPATQQYLNQWDQFTSLTPDSQAALDAQLELQKNKSLLGGSMYERMEDEYGNPMDWGQFGDYANLNDPYQTRQKAEDAMYNKATSRLDPQWDRAQSDKEAQLVAQGLRPGDPAYDRAMNEFDMAKTDAYDQALWSSVGEGRSEASQMFGQDLQSAQYENTVRQSQIAEEMQKRGFSLNEINAILTGQQVAMPQMPGFSQATKSEATDYLGAAQAQYSAELDAYSADQAAAQGMMSGIGSIAGLVMASDRRLKRNIKKIGEFAGLNLYEFIYLWGDKAIGFMADEVKKVYPDAVIRHESGYDRVDYGKILSEV